VIGETIMVMQEVLRVHPERAAAVVPSLHKCLRRLEGEESGRAAVVWMLGEYGQLIDDAPYLLEPLIDAVGAEPSVQVRCELLTATVKLFFKRPPELQAMMGRLFKACLADGVDALLHDRALLYYRLLRANVKEASAAIAAPAAPLKEFHEEVSPEVSAGGGAGARAHAHAHAHTHTLTLPLKLPFPHPLPLTGAGDHFQGVQHAVRAVQEALCLFHCCRPLDCSAASD
jgi:hypothetical protein